MSLTLFQAADGEFKVACILPCSVEMMGPHLYAARLEVSLLLHGGFNLEDLRLGVRCQAERSLAHRHQLGAPLGRLLPLLILYQQSITCQTLWQ